MNLTREVCEGCDQLVWSGGGLGCARIFRRVMGDGVSFRQAPDGRPTDLDWENLERYHHEDSCGRLELYETMESIREL